MSTQNTFFARHRAAVEAGDIEDAQFLQRLHDANSKQMSTAQEVRLRRILAYSLSGQYCYEACDIATRAEIDRLVLAIGKVFV